MGFDVIELYRGIMMIEYLSGPFVVRKVEQVSGWKSGWRKVERRTGLNLVIQIDAIKPGSEDKS